jgi:trimethylamine--corrinoid protein Co-methyltransferase
MALQSILVTVRHGQPLIISPSPAAGMTGPINMAGNVALATAEALAGITIAQMIREGTPVIFGLQSNGADLRTGTISIGSPAYALQAGYCARLARMYGLPSRGGGTTTDAKTVSVQSGYESMLSMLTAFQNKINLIVHSAGILDSFAGMSYEKFVVDLEIIEMVKFYLKDMAVDADALSFDGIKEVGPGGQFLTALDTFKKCRTHSWNPEISLRGTVTGNTPDGKLFENINQKINKMQDGYQKPELDAEIQKDLRRYLKKSGVDQRVVRKIFSL